MSRVSTETSAGHGVVRPWNWGPEQRLNVRFWRLHLLSKAVWKKSTREWLNIFFMWSYQAQHRHMTWTLFPRFFAISILFARRDCAILLFSLTILIEKAFCPIEIVHWRPAWKLCVVLPTFYLLPSSSFSSTVLCLLLSSLHCRVKVHAPTWQQRQRWTVQPSQQDQQVL